MSTGWFQVLPSRENKKQSTDAYTLSAIKPFIRLDSNGNLPACPGGGTYSPGVVVSNAPTCNVQGHAMP